MGTRTRRVRPWAAGLFLLVAAGLTACGTSPSTTGSVNTGTGTGTGTGTKHTSHPSSPSSPSASVSTPAAPAAVVLTPSVDDGATDVKVDSLVEVKASNGTLSKVVLTYPSSDGSGQQEVPGELNSGHTSWTASERLDPGITYKLKMVGENPEHASTTARSEFTTQNLSLAQQTFPILYPLKGSTVGVGMPVALTFDTPVTNKAAFERQLHVTSSPAQTGSWRWYSDREVHWRPASFWQPGTKVSVTADLNGVNAGNGIYGQKSTSTSFTIGRSVVTRIDLKADDAKVYLDGKLSRTIPVSAGKPGWVTRSGVKLVMDKLYVTRMTNQMIGAKEPYDLQVHYAMRLTASGEFMHAAPWNAAYFGRENASHGCVGMSTADAEWLFNHVEIGDPTITTGTDRGMEPGNGWTDWNASFAVYKKGSALA